MSRTGRCFSLLSVVFSATLGFSQASANAPQSATANSDANVSEISSRDEATTFKVNVNLVLVRVVVRDAQGVAVGNLKKEDFQLFDNRKPQTISKFTVDQAKGKANAEVKPEGGQDQITLPDRYIAYLFDDVHLTFGDLVQARDAAAHTVAGLAPADRAAVFTTSGQNMLDFTGDKDKILSALMRLRINAITGSGIPECPDVSFYLADLIQNKQDDRAFQLATNDALACAFGGDPRFLSQAQQLARTTAMRKLNEGDHETQVSLFTLQDIVKRIALMPGQRSIVLVSPGFFNPMNLRHQVEVGDRAVRSSVVINTLDARGLFTGLPDISRPTRTSNVVAQHQFETESATADAGILMELADATGGTFVHNTNDLEGGLRRLSSPPEYSYILGFSPQNLKSDGQYHNLKVSVHSSDHLTVQARKGYFAPAHDINAAEQAKQDIEDAVFSQDELHALPVELHTQFFKASDTAAQIAVLVKVDLRGIHFHKENGRNRNDLTVVSAVFDRDGNYISGNEKRVEMRLKDETLQRNLGSGVTLKSNFDVKPGSYLVRMVVRDNEGQISTENGAVEIPY